MSDLTQKLHDVASGPRKVQGDEGMVEQHRLDHLLDAARKEESAEAVKKPHRGMYFNRLVPPGTV